MAVKTFSVGETLTAADTNTYLANAGLVLITSGITVSSTGGTAATISNGTITIGTSNTSITVSNAFSATYDNYLIQINNGTSNGLDWLNLSFSGSTGTTYAWATFGQLWGTGGAGGSNTNTTSIRIGTHDTASYSVTAYVMNPFLAAQKQVYAQSASNQYFSNTNGRDTSAVSRTGFVISPTGAGNTLTGGSIRVFGFRQP